MKQLELWEWWPQCPSACVRRTIQISVSLVVESQLLTLESSSRAAMVANMVNPYLPLRPQSPTSGQPVLQGSVSSVMVFVLVNLDCVLLLSQRGRRHPRAQAEICFLWAHLCFLLWQKRSHKHFLSTYCVPGAMLGTLFIISFDPHNNSCFTDVVNVKSGFKSPWSGAEHLS